MQLLHEVYITEKPRVLGPSALSRHFATTVSFCEQPVRATFANCSHVIRVDKTVASSEYIVELPAEIVYTYWLFGYAASADTIISTSMHG